MELTDLKGIGKKSAQELNKKGVFSCADLAKLLPSKYYQVKEPTAFQPNLKAVTLKVLLLSSPKTQYLKGMTLTRAKAQCVLSGRVIGVVWFNQRYASVAYHEGQELLVFGNSRQNDVTVVLAKDVSKSSEILGFYPVYKKLGVRRSVLQSAIVEAQEKCEIVSGVPQKIEEQLGLLSLGSAYRLAHIAKDKKELEQALYRIELERAVEYLLKEGEFKRQNRVLRGKIPTGCVSEFEQQLPFALTSGQKAALNDILSDFSSDDSCNRLVQGEVGSGKTLVALLSALVCVRAGYQVAFMAPTELLAKQHFESFQKFFGQKVKGVLLTSGTENRAAIEKQVQLGQAEIVFGTHILAQSVVFHRLGLVVIDEQQRFGVEMRAALVQKSKTRDCVLLTATPIPRSLLLSMAGVLSCSSIKERPNSNCVETHFVGKSKESELWDFIGKEKKSFVVCPRIEEVDDPLEKQTAASVKDMEKKLVQKFGKESVVRVDGSMQSAEQQKKMELFKTGGCKVLVATTVVEVGVDVPEATAIVICNAERFGLSTLHQLRGRVGRSGEKAHCFLLFDKKPSEESMERLEFFKQNNDGFAISEFDFKHRGAGDVFGTRQSGEAVVQFSSEVLMVAQKVVEGRQKQVLVSQN